MGERWPKVLVGSYPTFGPEGSTVEVVVKQHLRCPLDLLPGDRRACTRFGEDGAHDRHPVKRREASVRTFTDVEQLAAGVTVGPIVGAFNAGAIAPTVPTVVQRQGDFSQIFDPITGKRERLDEMVARRERGEEVWVSALGGDFKLKPARVSATMRSGVQEVFRLRTRPPVVAGQRPPIFTQRIRILRRWVINIGAAVSS